MAQRIVTVCDQCQALGEDAPGVTWTLGVQVPGGKFATYEVDSCSEHSKPFADLAQFLSDLGRPVGSNGKPRKAASVPSDEPEVDRTCPVCGFVSVNRAAVRSHLRQQHGQTMSQAQGAAADYTCPDCGDTFTSPQGMGAHRSRTHGVAGSSKGAKQAREKNGTG